MGVSSSVVHELLWQARRRRRLTQSELAGRVNCSQSAISMFESGRADALSQEKVALMADILGVDIKSSAAEEGLRVHVEERTLKYCPVDDCPSNLPYVSRGQLCYHPTMIEAAALEKTCCRDCGEFLEARCPNAACGAPVSEGSFCTRCGAAYVTVTERRRGSSLVEWADRERARIREVRAMSGAHAVAMPPARVEMNLKRDATDAGAADAAER